MISTLSYLVAVVCVASALGKLVAPRRRPASPSRTFFALGELSLGASFAAAAPATRDLAADLEPFPHAIRFASNTLGMLAGWCALAMLWYAMRDPVRARRLVRWHLVLLVLVVLARLTLLQITSPPSTPELTVTHGGDPLVAAYVLLHVGYMALAMAQFARLTHSYSQRATSRALRTGLRLTLLGLIFGGIWATWKTAIVVVRLLGTSFLQSASDASSAIAALCGLFIAVGASYASWARPLRALVRPLLIRRAYTRLEPLWAAVTAAVPEVHLGEAETREEALYRRVIEIRDAQFTLIARLPGSVATDTEQLLRHRKNIDKDTRAVIIDAACLQVALDAHHRGHLDHADSEPPLHPSGAQTGLLAAAAWLARVEHARHTDPTVAAIRQTYHDKTRSRAATIDTD